MAIVTSLLQAKKTLRQACPPSIIMRFSQESIPKIEILVFCPNFTCFRNVRTANNETLVDPRPNSFPHKPLPSPLPTIQQVHQFYRENQPMKHSLPIHKIPYQISSLLGQILQPEVLWSPHIDLNNFGFVVDCM
jgi:hypothetical protein